MVNGWSIDQIDSCAVRQTKANCRQSGQYYYLSPLKSQEMSAFKTYLGLVRIAKNMALMAASWQLNPSLNP